MTFTDVLKKIPGLVHYYPLVADTKDVIGTAHGTNHGVTFSGGHGIFNGSAYVELPDSDDFSVATKGGLSIVAFLTIDNWAGKGASEYVHWAGKGRSGSHEWTFRHYVKGGSGEASTRQGRCSFYHYNPSGGLGAGSYYQDSSFPTTERVFTATCNMSTLSLAVNGTIRDTDPLSGYSIIPKNTGSLPCLGTRGDNTGFLVGKIRRVAFYNRVLTSSEIATIYAARNDADGPVVTPPIDPPPPSSVEDYVATTTTVVEKHNALVATLKTKGILL